MSLKIPPLIIGWAEFSSDKALETRLISNKKTYKSAICRFLSTYSLVLFSRFCGKTGIRTPGTSQFNGFQDRRNRPLCHLSSRFVSQMRCKGTHYFWICKCLTKKFNYFFALMTLKQENTLVISKIYTNGEIHSFTRDQIVPKQITANSSTTFIKLSCHLFLLLF